MAGFRMDRINSQLLREISQLLITGIKDERTQGAIITSVNCSRDLKHARVYFTTLDEGLRGSTGEALRKAAGTLRASLGKALRLRTVPELTFVFDNSEIKAREMDAFLDKVAPPMPQEEESSHQTESEHDAL